MNAIRSVLRVTWPGPLSLRGRRLSLWLALLLSSTVAARAGTIGEYRFERSGNLVIEESQGVVGSHTGTTTSDVPNAVVPQTGTRNLTALDLVGGQSAVVDGQPFVLHAGASGNNADATVEWWMKLPDREQAPGLTRRPIFRTRGGDIDANRFDIALTAEGRIGGGYRDPAGVFHGISSDTTDSRVPLGQWVHVALVRHDLGAAGHRYEWYFNGAINPAATVVDVDPNLPTSTDWTVAGQPGNPVDVTIDEIRFSDEALTPDRFLNSFRPAPACVTTVITVVNDSGSLASELRVTFDAARAMFVDPSSVVAGGCPPPAVPDNGTVRDTVTLRWPTACIPDGGGVAFVVKTPANSVNFVSGAWSDPQGQEVGVVLPGNVNVLLPTDDCIAIKVMIRYLPRGAGFYTPWIRFPAGKCWWRWCCLPVGLQCWFRVVVCEFPDPVSKLLERRGRCAFLTPWLRGPVIFPNQPYFWQRITVEVPAGERVRGPAPDAPPDPDRPEEPSPDAPAPPSLDDLEVAYNLPSGDVYRGADFSSAFYKLYQATIVRSESRDTEIVGFEATLRALAPGFRDGARELTPLIEEIEFVGERTGDGDLSALSEVLSLMRGAMSAIGDAFAEGVAPEVGELTNLADALRELGSAFRGLGDERFTNAAAVADSMIEGVGQAISSMEQGLEETVNQDFFLWGVQNRFQPLLHHFARALLPHVRVHVEFTDERVWFPSTIEGFTVLIENAETGELLDQRVATISDLGHFDVDTLGLQGRLRLSFRVPGYRSQEVEVDVEDGASTTARLDAGDVDGDGDIDRDDVVLVNESLGQGGLDAGSVPAADVNADGVVDATDLEIVAGNAGPEFLRGDCNGSGAVNIADASCILKWLFADDDPPGCVAASNANGDDNVDITDAVYLLDYLFTGGPPPVEPFPDCGPGMLPADEQLGCANPPDCP